jgi:glycosyltransferase involved in cell wall biosynthesis
VLDFLAFALLGMDLELSIVLPAYNEEGNIERAVREADRAGAALAAAHEVVVVDDGSRDGTGARLAALHAELGDRLQVVRHPINQGYGTALRNGFAAARGRLVFYTDSDNQFDLMELRDFLPLMGEWDALLGYRRDRQDPPLRLFTSRVFNGLTSRSFGMRIRDLNCSFKLFRREVLARLPLESRDFFIDAELVARLHRGGFRYRELPVTHYPRTVGRSTVRPGDVPRTLRSLFRMWRRIRRAPALSAPPSAAPSTGRGWG